MIQTNLSDLFGSDEPDVPVAKEDPLAVMKILTAKSCNDCRLGAESPNNPGFLWKGNRDAHVVVIGDMPSAADMSARRAFADGAGNELNQWLKLGGVDAKDVFFTYLVQCKTPQSTSKTAVDGQQRDVEVNAEIGVCFHPRCVRMVKALPNAEVIWALGFTTQTALLGGEPRFKTHQGFWFGTDIFPGKAVFGLPHPREYDRKTSQAKRGRLRQHLTYFKNEYHGKTNKSGEVLCAPKHVMDILKYRAQERQDAIEPDVFW